MKGKATGHPSNPNEDRGFTPLLISGMNRSIRRTLERHGAVEIIPRNSNAGFKDPQSVSREDPPKRPVFYDWIAWAQGKPIEFYPGPD